MSSISPPTTPKRTGSSRRSNSESKITRSTTIETNPSFFDRYQVKEHFTLTTVSTPSDVTVDRPVSFLIGAINYTGEFMVIIYRYITWMTCSNGYESDGNNQHDPSASCLSESMIDAKSAEYVDLLLLDESLTNYTFDERYITTLRTISTRPESRDDDAQLQALHDFRVLVENDLLNTSPLDDDIPLGITRIQHCQQQENWDCGIACVQMILRWLRSVNNGCDSSSNPAIEDPPSSSVESGSLKNMKSDCIYGGSKEISAQEVKERTWMLRAIGAESIWTIDLIILLQKLLSEYRQVLHFPQPENDELDNVTASYLFCSSNLGVDESYNDYSYYKGAYKDDVIRVTDRFNLAKNLGLPMACISGLDLPYVVDIISKKNCVAIVLLDNRILLWSVESCPTEKTRMTLSESQTLQYDLSNQSRTTRSSSSAESGSLSYESIHDDDDIQDKGRHTIMHDNYIDTLFTQTQDNDNDEKRYSPLEKLSNDDSSSMEPTTDSSYTGHYVILCGISTNPDDIAEAKKHFIDTTSPQYCMVIKNPACDQPVMFMTPQHFELAWRANGTDEDLIFVAKLQNNI